MLPPPLLHDPFSPFSTSINVTWDPLPDNFTFSEYVIRYRPLPPAKVDTSISSESGETEWEQPQAFKRKKLHRKIPYMEKRVSSLNETTVVLLNLKPFTVYEITVAAGSGEGEPSEVKKVTTREGGRSCLFESLGPVTTFEGLENFRCMLYVLKYCTCYSIQLASTS